MHGITDEQNYVDIANAIREKNGSDTQYLPSEMADAIGALPNTPQFGSIGWDGEDVNLYEKLLAGAITYSKTLYDKWNPNATEVTGFFANDEKLIIAPKIDLSNTNEAIDMFRDCSNLLFVPLLDTSNVINLGGFFIRCSKLLNIPLLDVSKANSLGALLLGCTALTSVPQFDTSNVMTLSDMFQGCTALTSVPQFDTGNVKATDRMFQGCTALENLGGFKNLKVSLNLSYSPLLTHDSLMNVINNLYDLASNGLSAQTLTLGATNLAKLTNEEKAVAVNKGWTLA